MSAMGRSRRFCLLHKKIEGQTPSLLGGLCADAVFDCKFWLICMNGVVVCSTCGWVFGKVLVFAFRCLGKS